MPLCPKDSGAEADARGDDRRVKHPSAPATSDRALAKAPRLFTSGLVISGKAQRPQEMRLERLNRNANRRGPAQIRELGHLQTFITTRIDPPEGLQIEAHIHREPVIARAPANTDTDAGQLSALNVDAG